MITHIYLWITCISSMKHLWISPHYEKKDLATIPNSHNRFFLGAHNSQLEQGRHLSFPQNSPVICYEKNFLCKIICYNYISRALLLHIVFGIIILYIDIISFSIFFSGETGFAALAKNPEFVAAIQKSFANQENKDDRKLLSACPINYKLIHSNLIKLFPKLYKQYF